MSDTHVTPADVLPPPKRYHRIGLFGPIALVVVAAAAWSGYWFYTAHQVQKVLQTQQDGMVKQGYQVSSEPYKVRGYPYRMYVEFHNLTIIAPSGRGVSVPVLDAEANAYALDKWVMNAPQGMTLYRGRTNPGVAGGVDLGKLTVTASSLRFSASHLRSPVPDIRFQGTGVTVVPSDPSHPFTFQTADLLEAYVRPDAAQTDSADWLVRLEGAKGQPPGLVGRFSPQKPLDLHIEGTLSKVSAFKGVDFATGLKAWKSGGVASGFRCEIKNPDVGLMASSDALSFDPSNHLTGKMHVELSGAAAPLDLLAAAGLISEDNMTLAKPLLDMTLGIGNQKFDIEFKKGGAYIGPLKVSDAPILP